MEFQEFWKQKERMCNLYNKDGRCRKKCELCSFNNNAGTVCDVFVSDHPKEAEAIVQKWADEHPVQTNIDKFAEIFGIDPIEIEGLDKTTYQGFCDWWSEEYIPPESEEEWITGKEFAIFKRNKQKKRNKNIRSNIRRKHSYDG